MHVHLTHQSGRRGVMDRLGNLEAFVEAAELGSFTLAAERLRLSPSALSRRVAQLEEETGVRLFHRTTRAVRLSEEGRAFFERSRGALRELREAHEATARLHDRPAGLLRVEAPSILGRHVVVPGLARFASRYPEVQVELTLRDHPGDPVAEGIDLALRLGALEDSTLVARRLGRTRMRVCGAPAYLKRRGTPRTVDALSRHERLAPVAPRPRAPVAAPRWGKGARAVPGPPHRGEQRRGAHRSRAGRRRPRLGVRLHDGPRAPIRGARRGARGIRL